MAIRRRRKTLTNLLSNMERRVTKVELRNVNLLTSGQIQAAIDPEEDPLDGGPDSVVSPNAPNQYKAVVNGYYYSSNLTGTSPRVELYFETDPGLEKDNTIRISGIHHLRNNNTAVPFEISGDYKTLAVDTPPWEGRSTYSGTRQTPPETVVSTAIFNPATGNEYGGARQLIINRRIASVEATTTTAKITFTLPNYFAVNDVVFVGMPSDSPFYGLDGLFRVKEVGSNFITYDLPSALDEPINVAAITEERYVYATAQSAIRDGATWIDTSTDPDTVYVWKDIRWGLLNSSTVSKDDTIPNPVTNLQATSENDTAPGSTSATSRITLTWDRPEENTDGSPLDDLSGYSVWYRQYLTQEWEKVEYTGAETSWAKGGFLQGRPAYFAVYALDSSRQNRSDPTEITHTPGVTEREVDKPKAPTVTTYLGTIKIAYDDLTASGLVQASTAKEIEVFFSDVDNFTPGPTNYYGLFPANAGSYIIIPGTELEDSTDYYVKIRVRDIYGNITEPSDQVSVRVKLKDIITYDMIDVGTLTGQVIIGLDIRSNSNPSVNGGVIINQQGITAYAPPSGGGSASQTFRINALDGSVNIGSYLGKTEAAGLYISETKADGRYATIATATGIATIATSANSAAILLDGRLDDAEKNLLDAFTIIEPGSVTIKKSKVIGSINDSTTDTTEINGGVIKTGTLSASKITTGTLDASRVSVTNISASNIETGTLTGRTVQTNSSGQRIVIDSSGASTGNRIRVYNTDGAQVGTIIGGAATSSGLRLIYTTGTEVNLFSNSVTLETTNSLIRVSGSSTRSSTRFTVDTASLTLFPMALSGNIWSVLQTYSTGASVARNLSGTGTRNLNVDSSGLLTTSSSDLRKKKDIKDLNLSVDFINSLRPVTFRWKQPDPSVTELEKYNSVDSEDRVNMGLIAQELKQTLEEHGLDSASIIGSEPADAHRPYLEDGDNEPILSIDYPQLVPALIKAVQELSARLEVLERQKD